MKKILIIFLIFIFVFPILAKDGEWETEYLYENSRMLLIDGYGFGMGGAAGGVLGKPVNFYNHAKDAFLRGFDFSAGMGMYYYNNDLEKYISQSYYASATFPIKDWFMMNITGSNTSLLLPNRDTANPWEDAELNENNVMKVDFSLSRKIPMGNKTKFGFAMTGKYVSQTIKDPYLTTEIHSEEDIGKGFGADVSFLTQFNISNNVNMNLGAAVIDVLQPVDVTMGKYFGGAISFRHVLFYQNAKLNIAGDYYMNYSDSNRISAGIEEWLFNEMLAIRAGYTDAKITTLDDKLAFNNTYNTIDDYENSEGEQYNVYNPESQITVGLGFKKNGIMANVSYAFGSEYTGNSLSFDIGYTGEKTKKVSYKVNPKITLDGNSKFISPNGDGNKDQIRFNIAVQNVEKLDEWKLIIYNEKGNDIKKFEGKKTLPKSVTWDGQIKKGSLKDGNYYAVAEVEDSYGNEGSSNKYSFELKRTKPSIDLSYLPDKLNPGKGNFKFMITLIDPVDVTKTRIIVQKDQKVIHEISYDGIKDGYFWDGKIKEGEYPEKGEILTAYAEVVDKAGNTGKSELIDITVGKSFVEKEEETEKLPSIFIAARIRFATSSSKLSGAERAKLQEVIDIVKEHPEVKIRIEGHTDSRGDAQTNKKLSVDRANIVKTYLTKNGISNDKMVVVGYGEEMPIDTNKTEAGRANNRRVDVILISN